MRIILLFLINIFFVFNLQAQIENLSASYLKDMMDRDCIRYVPSTNTNEHTSFGGQADGLIYVNASASGNNDGTSWDNAYSDLQNALENANEGDEIWVAKGTYLPEDSMEIPLSGNNKKTFYITQDVKIYGGFAGTENALEERVIENNPTILSGDFNSDDIADDYENNRTDNAINVVFVEAAVTTASLLDGLIIEGGHAAGDTLFITDLRGGGIFSWGAIQVSNCTFRQNFAEAFGGGLYYRDEAANGAKVTNCTFEKNACLLSGGGMIAANQTMEGVTVDNCFFNENRADYGGAGLYSSGSKLTVTNCNITDNKSGTWGALYIWSDQNNPDSYLINHTIENCVFENNTGQVGGGFGSWATSFELKDCTFSNNQAVTNDTTLNTLGGAIFFQFSQTVDKRKVNIQNCDFENNTSEEESGAIGIYDVSANTESNEITIDNCLFKENSSPNTGAIGISLMSNDININNSIFDGNQGGTASAIGGGNPMLSGSFYLHLNNCLFTNHVASNQLLPVVGFARFKATINNCTIAGNESSGIGVQGLSDIRIQNTIFDTPEGYLSTGTISADPEVVFTSLGGNLFSDDTAAPFALDIDLQNADPLFETGTYQLSENSPCIDKGVLPDEMADFDLAGNARIQGSCIDIGAYESSYDADTECQMFTNTKEILATASTVIIYPNPVTESTSILLENNWQGNIQIRIINMLGQVQAIQTIEKTSEQFQLDLDTSDLVQGNYQILISNGKQMAISSFVKM